MMMMMMMMIIIMHRSIRNFNLHPRAIEPLKIGWIKPPPPPCTKILIVSIIPWRENCLSRPVAPKSRLFTFKNPPIKHVFLCWKESTHLIQMPHPTKVRLKPPPPPQSKDDGEMRAARGLHGKMLKLWIDLCIIMIMTVVTNLPYFITRRHRCVKWSILCVHYSSGCIHCLYVIRIFQFLQNIEISSKINDSDSNQPHLHIATIFNLHLLLTLPIKDTTVYTVAVGVKMW